MNEATQVMVDQQVRSLSLQTSISVQVTIIIGSHGHPEIFPSVHHFNVPSVAVGEHFSSVGVCTKTFVYFLYTSFCRSVS